MKNKFIILLILFTFLFACNDKPEQVEAVKPSIHNYCNGCLFHEKEDWTVSVCLDEIEIEYIK